MESCSNLHSSRLSECHRVIEADLRTYASVYDYLIMAIKFQWFLIEIQQFWSIKCFPCNCGYFVSASMCSSICIRCQFVRRDLLQHIICLSARQTKHEKGNIMYDMSGGIDLAITSLWRSVTSREEMSTPIMERSGKKRVVLSKPKVCPTQLNVHGLSKLRC